MGKVIDMQLIRYMNLFNQITGVKTDSCFFYNNGIFFVVPKPMLARSIGENSINLKKLGSIIGKRIRIIGDVGGKNRIKNFVSSMIQPIEVNGIEVTEEEIIISAPMQSRAMIIGRNKTKLEEMKKIVRDNFNKELRLVE